MGISSTFLKSLKFIKFGPIFNLLLLTSLILPGFVKAQNNSADIPVIIDGKKYFKHTVQKEETIYGIAEKFHLQPKDIVLENPSAIDGVHVGDVLLIPLIANPGDTSSVSKTQQKQGNYIYHEVLKKETLYSLAKKYNTTIGIIDSVNPGLAATGLQNGMTIRIPVAQSQPGIVNKPKGKNSIVKDTGKVVQPEQQKEENANKYETQAYKTLVTEQIHGDSSKSASLNKDTGRKLTRYNIGLIMPFAAEGSDTILLSRLLDGTEQVPFTTRISVDFYHGILMAFDSLAKKGLKTNLTVLNILSGPDSSYHTTDFIVKNPEMLQMNLIIGPPFPSNFKRVARFTGLHNIPIVSPLSGENSVLDNNIWTSKTVPSAITETEYEAAYIVSHYRNANFILLHNKEANDVYYKAFKKQFTKADSAFGSKDSLYIVESLGGAAGIKSKLIKNGVNVVVLPYQEASFIAKFVNEFANTKYATDNSIVLFGMHNWANNDALDPTNLDTLNCHFPSNEFVNYDDLSTKRFIMKYRSNYLSEPSYYSYEGYDAGMFYGNLLQLYGTDIQSHLSDIKYMGLQTSFDMFRTIPSNGYENKAVYMLEYQNFTEKLDSK